MKSVWVLLRREMLSYFVSPVAYTLLIVFLGMTGYFFTGLLTTFVRIATQNMEQSQMLQQMPAIMNVNMGVMRPWFNTTSQLMLFLAPIITMRLLAEERGTGRIDLLLSAPITDFQLVLGKFLAGFALCALFLLPTFVFPAILFNHGNPELGQIVTGYAGLLLLSLALISLGLTVSALTSSQVVAAAATFGITILLWIIGAIHSEGTLWRTALSSVSLLDHFGEFANGVVELRNVVYYLSFTVFMLFVSLRAVESQRWRG